MRPAFVLAAPLSVLASLLYPLPLAFRRVAALRPSG